MATHEVLTPSQRKQFIEVLGDLDKRAIARYYTLSTEDIRIIQRQRGAQNQLGFAIQLCYLRFPGYPLSDNDRIPDEVLLYVAQQLKIRTKWIKRYGQTRGQTLDDHLETLQKQFGFRVFEATIEKELAAWLLPGAIDIDNGFVLVATLMEEMRTRRVMLPALSTLEELVWYVQKEAQQRLFEGLTSTLTQTQQDALDKLLDLRTEPPTITYLAWLREPLGPAKPINFQRSADRLDYIRKIGLDPELAKSVPPHRLAQFALQGERLTAQRVDNLMDPAEQYAILVAFLLHKIGDLTDHCLQMHDQLVGTMFNKSDKQHVKQFHRSGKAINHIVRLYGDVGKKVIQARSEGRDPYGAIEEILLWEAYIQSVQDAENLVRPNDFDALDLIDTYYSSMRHYSPRLLDTFEFNGSAATQSLREGIQVLRTRNHQSSPKPIPEDAPLGFVKPRWKQYVVREDGTINHRYYELCLLSEVRNTLRSGDLWAKGSQQFKDFEEYLISKVLWDAMRDNGTIPLPIETNFQLYIAQRAAVLHERLMLVNDLVARNQLPGVTVKNGRFTFKRVKGEEPPPGTDDLSALIDKILPRIRITELLAEVDDWTRFSRRFTNARTGEIVEDTTELLAVILADGINLSLPKMADASAKLTEDRLTYVYEWYIREATYRQALVELVNFHHRQPFASYWGDGTTSSSDGQFFPVDGKRSALAQVNKHYGFQPDLMQYTHHSDQHQSYNIDVINPHEHQAPHIVDGVLHHQTELAIREHYADTGGYTDHIFAILHLLGIGFAPRIRDLNEKRLFCIEDPTLYPALEPWIGGRITVKRIEPHWDEVLRLVTSIQTGTVSAALIMKRLAAYTRQNSIAGALEEIGRIEKTLFMLEWLLDPELRRRVMVGLDKGEKKNAVSRAVYAHRQGQMHGVSYEDQLASASGLNLLVMAIVNWNTVYMAHAIETLRAQGYDITDEQIKHLSPLRWEHIILTGDFVWEKLLPSTTDNLRPLRMEHAKKRTKRSA